MEIVYESSLSCFNEAGARTPRISEIKNMENALKAKASMRPGRERPGYMDLKQYEQGAIEALQ